MKIFTQRWWTGLLAAASVWIAVFGAGAAFGQTGSFTDTRDGKTYKTVKMPDGKTWMGQNLNYKPSKGSWCCESEEAYPDEYGLLYNWNAAKTVCPTGWHLPSAVEWNNLAKATGGVRTSKIGMDEMGDDFILWYWKDVGKKLKSKVGWEEEGDNRNGTDNYGFSAMPSGSGHLRAVRDGSGTCALWWTSTSSEHSSGYAKIRIVGMRDIIVCGDGLCEETGDKSESYHSVRCVQN